MRFIDLARDGGCSKKASALDLQCMLGSVARASQSAALTELANALPDVGHGRISGVDAICTVDVIYPMTLDAKDFGHIAANHALSDIYAVFGKPRIALSILGIPHGIEATSAPIVDMLTAASEELNRAGVSLVGGHTLAKQSELFLGFAVIGEPKVAAVGKTRRVIDGDGIFLTKPLGTSVASNLWRLEESMQNEFRDVLEGMRTSLATTSEIISNFGVEYATDVSGYGLVNHLHLLLRKANCSATIKISDIPIYATIAALTDTRPTSSQFYANAEYANKFSNSAQFLGHPLMNVAMDAQVAGGLVFICPRILEGEVFNELQKSGIDGHLIGRCNTAATGYVEFVK